MTEPPLAEFGVGKAGRRSAGENFFRHSMLNFVSGARQGTTITFMCLLKPRDHHRAIAAVLITIIDGTPQLYVTHRSACPGVVGSLQNTLPGLNQVSSAAVRISAER